MTSNSNYGQGGETFEALYALGGRVLEKGLDKSGLPDEIAEKFLDYIKRPESYSLLGETLINIFNEKNTKFSEKIKNITLGVFFKLSEYDLKNLPTLSKYDKV